VSALTFELRQKPEQRLDLSPLVPARLAELKPKEINALVIGTTRTALTVGDVFKVKRDDPNKLRFVDTDELRQDRQRVWRGRDPG
jgi:formylmethanofuran dehydrogenase subunit C